MGLTLKQLIFNQRPKSENIISEQDKADIELGNLIPTQPPESGMGLAPPEEEKEELLASPEPQDPR